MALPYGRYSSVLMSALLSLHPIKSFEKQRPESVPHATLRQEERERLGRGVCQAKKTATYTVKRTSLLFNYRQCMLGKSTEYHQDRRTETARGQSGYD